MNIAQLSEQLKDVPQGTLVGYAKNPNSVVPQFLALAEIQRRQSLQAPAPAPTGTVADDVLAQAAPPQMAPTQMAPQQVDPRLLQAQAMQQQAQQLPENQPGVARLPSGMPQGMAAGGIVAFAEGGLNMDDDEDDREMAQLFPKQSGSRFEQLQQLLSTLPSTVAGGIRGLAEKGAAKYKDVVSGMPGSVGEMRKDISNAASGATDNIEEFLAKIKHLESRGRSFDSKGNILTSPKGAQGSMQVMPKTQVNPGFGVTPARDKSPEELERVGREYGIAMLNEFKDPKLAAMAYNWGPANVKKWLASDRSTPIPKETSKYASNFAEGGAVKPEELGAKLEAYDSGIASLQNAVGSRGVRAGGADPELVNALNSAISQRKALQKEYESSLIESGAGRPAIRYQSSLARTQPVADPTVQRMSAQPAIAVAPAPVVPVQAPIAPAPTKQSEDGTKAIPQYGAMPSDEELKNMDIGFGSGRFGPSAAVPSELTTAPKTKADLYAEALEQSLEKQMAEAAQNKKLQLGLALLGASAAGLQSGSPYFSQGIGASLAGGVNTYGALKKQEQDQAKDIMAARLGLYKYGAASESAAANRALEKEYKDLTLAQREKIAELDRNVKIEDIASRKVLAARDDLRQFEQMKLKALQERFPIPMPKDPSYQAALQAIYNSPEYKQLFALAGYSIPTAPSAPAGNRPPIGSFNK
jgi:hypothetical protein